MRFESQYIVVVGCGRLGAYLANRLSEAGSSVVVIDVSPDAFRNLSVGFSGFHIEGDGTELGVLAQAKAEQADLLLATTRRDNVNLMVAQLAKSVLGVPRVIARVFDPQREESYRGLGVDTICSTIVAGQAFWERLSEAPKS